MLFVLLLLLAGSLRIAWRTQDKIALQSRLDVCALRMALERKSALRRVATANQALTLTFVGISVARGAKAAGPAGAVLGGASEAVLLRMNASLAALQDAQLLAAGGRELARMRCEPGRFSREPAACVPSPFLASAMRREKTIFPDVKGTLTHSSDGKRLASFRCRAGVRDAAAVELRGEARLAGGELADEWTE